MALRFSIVTPTLNRRAMLAEALDSVAGQDWTEGEHIVVDGGSTDGTLELVASRPEVRLVGGPDSGVYDALNKGIAAATGDIVGLLNSDDAYEADAFGAVAEAFENNPSCESVCGSARLVAGNEVIEVYDREADKRLTSARTALLGASILNARFFRKATLDRIGPFSVAYRIVSDRDLLTRAITLGLRTHPIEKLVYTYRRHHASLSFSGDAAQRPAIWRELLDVAHFWSQAEEASSETRCVARALEGRCLGRLIQQDLSAGRPADAWRLLHLGKRGLLGNLGLVAKGILDVAARPR